MTPDVEQTSRPGLFCPGCRSRMAWPEHCDSNVVCSCGKNYPSLLGIVDLRSGEDPYCGNTADNSIARNLACHFDRLNFQALLEYYFVNHCPELGPDDVRRQISHILRSDNPIEMCLDSEFSRLNSDLTVADLGTGTGTAIIALTKSGISAEAIVGVDIALRWLVLARKRLMENGLEAVRLLCANAEAIPLESGRYSIVFGGDMIEHVTNPSGVFTETARLLAPGGKAVYPTPNRFSLGREPHVGLFFAGWLPRRLAPAYCRWRGSAPWQGIFTRSAGGWNRLLSGLFFDNPGIFYSISPGLVARPGGRLVRLIHAYNSALQSSRFFRLLALLFGPILLVQIKRREEGA